MALALTFIELDLRSTSSVDNLAQFQFIVVETKKTVKLCCVLRVEYFLLEMVFESDLLFASHYIFILCRNNIWYITLRVFVDQILCKKQILAFLGTQISTYICSDERQGRTNCDTGLWYKQRDMLCNPQCRHIIIIIPATIPFHSIIRNLTHKLFVFCCLFTDINKSCVKLNKTQTFTKSNDKHHHFFLD